MTQEDKDLLFKELSARHPYGVKLQVRLDYGDNDHKEGTYDADIKVITSYNIEVTYYDTNMGGKARDWTFMYEEVKPYLRPMSSMTEEEIREFTSLIFISDSTSYGYLKECVLFAIYSAKALDWLNAHHFDYRSLIEKGLALEAPANIYSTFSSNINYINGVAYDLETDKVDIIYKSGKKISYDVNSLKIISSDERELGVERDYLIEPNIHVVFYPEGHLSTFYFDE